MCVCVRGGGGGAGSRCSRRGERQRVDVRGGVFHPVPGCSRGAALAENRSSLPPATSAQ